MGYMDEQVTEHEAPPGMAWDATAVPVLGEAESPGTPWAHRACVRAPGLGCAILGPGCSIGTFPGPRAAPHPLLPPAVFILRPGRIGCWPGREHQESVPWQTNQTPPKPGEPQGQRSASELLPILDGSATQGGAAPAGNSIPPVPATSANPETWDAHLDKAASIRNSRMMSLLPHVPNPGLLLSLLVTLEEPLAPPGSQPSIPA